MADNVNFCTQFDCLSINFFSKNFLLHSNVSEAIYYFQIQGEDPNSGDIMQFYPDYNNGTWFGNATSAVLQEGSGERYCTEPPDENGHCPPGAMAGAEYNLANPMDDTTSEFCHPGLGCTDFGNGSSII